MSADLRRRAIAWRDHDPDETTRAEIDRLLVAGDDEALRDCCDGTLRFGTAGLRAPVGAGPRRMNRAVIRRATAGLIAHLDDTGRRGPLVVGRDARTGSAAFLTEVVAVAGGAGREVLVLPEPCPTPLLAFAVLELGAAAGVMITASHNPAGDNGFKVYLDDGMQLVSPDDEAVAARIDGAGPADRLPLDPSARRDVDPSVLDHYLGAVAALSVRPDARSVRFAYTPLHGVGGRTALAAFDRAGFLPPAVVREQFEPDPAFPTVPFPNPEEIGAMDRVQALARAENLGLALAHDPDADRLGAALRDRTGWRPLSGDEIGVLIADHLLRHGRRSPRDTVVTTVVSSRLLFAVAAAHGVRAVETLTGFKWVVRAAPPDEFLFGYEEALGYLVGGPVRDKDGISAALILAEAASVAELGGSTLADRLDDLARAHGLHATDRFAIRAEGVAGLDRLTRAMHRLRSRPPASFGDADVLEVEDLRDGGRLPAADVLVLHTTLGRVVLRPSGTEPKLKAAFETVVAVESGDVDAARTVAAARLAALVPAVRALFG